MTVTVLIPAHDEEEGVGLALRSLVDQTRRPEHVVVVCDNCADGTASVAARYKPTLFFTTRNAAKKAGALNQALATILPGLEDGDFVMVMDADSELDEPFLEGALARFAEDPRLGGVSGTFRGGPGGGYVGWAQRNEYGRYGRDVRRLKGKALVLTGTAAMFRVSALRDVVRARRDDRLPAGGLVYDEHVLTEDNEVSLALLHLGWRILAPRECLLTTEVMQTWGDLARQRLRWKRGAFENLVDYGLTRVTARYWGRQVLSALSVLCTFLYLATLGWAVTAGQFHWQPFWVLVTGLFCVERFVTVKDRGLLVRLLALPLVFEVTFDVFLQGVQAWAFLSVLTRRKGRW